MKLTYLFFLIIFVGCSSKGGDTYILQPSPVAPNAQTVTSPSACTATNIFGQSLDQDGNLCATSSPPGPVHPTCVAGAIVPGCDYPAPANYPGNIKETACADYAGSAYVPVVDGSSGNAIVCMNYSLIENQLQGNYAIYGVPYFTRFPLIIGPDCGTSIQFDGGTVNVCF